MLIKSFPKYVITLPGGKKIKYRPFTVKEENSLLIAKQSENNENILETLVEVLNECSSDKTEEYDIIDFEALFIQVRSKSIGEIENATIKCPETNQQVKVSINLIEDIKYHKSNTTNTIQLSNKSLIKLKPLKIKDILKNSNYNKNFEDKINFIANNIVSIQNDNEIINTEDIDLNERIEYCLNLQSKDFKKIINYYDDCSKIYYLLNYKLQDGTEKTIQLSGLFNIISFFLTI